MLITFDCQTSVLSESEALVKQRFSQLLCDTPYFALVSYPWRAALVQGNEQIQLRDTIARECVGTVVTYTDTRLNHALLQHMVALGISDVFYADLYPEVTAPSGITLWPAPAVAAITDGKCWQIAGIRFARVLATDPASRLWYCIEHNIIPVLSLQKLTLPGLQSLWLAASIDCSENHTADSRIDTVVTAVAADKQLVDAKLAALKQLKFIYGDQCFIYDMLSFAANDTHYLNNRLLMPLKRHIAELRRVHDKAQRNTLLTMIKTSLLLHRDAVALALTCSREGLDFSCMLASLTAQERQSLSLFAARAKLLWLSELTDEI